MGAPESSTPKATGTVSRVSTYLIMNGTKVAGVYIILKEQGGEGRNWVLVAGAALALGAQTVEAARTSPASDPRGSHGDADRRLRGHNPAGPGRSR
jgi:hypothetical protein